MFGSVFAHALLLSVAVASSSSASEEPAPGTYTLHILDTSGAGLSEALGVDPSGAVIVGMVKTSSLLPAAWIDGVRHDLPLPPGTSQGSAYGVNQRGAIVGTGNVPLEQAFVYRNGSLTLLQPIEGARTFAQGIDDAGFAVGASSDSAASHPHAAVMWTPDGTPIPLGSPPSATSIARAINESHQIVGESAATLSTLPLPFLWANGRFRFLDTLPGDPHGLAVDVNEHGVIVGSSIRAGAVPGLWDYEAVVWVNGIVQGLAMPEGISWSRCNAINNQGDIVGDARRHPNNGNHPFLFSHGAVVFLEELAAKDGWTFYTASDINEAGVIVGTGKVNGDFRAFMLTPW